MQINPLTKIYDDFVTIAKGVVIKYNEKANVLETLDMKKRSDGYIVARRKEDTFLSYYAYDLDILSTVMGIPIENENELNVYYNDRRLIPEMYREQLLVLKRQRTIDNYVEENNYYRTLAGLPDIEESSDEWIYLSKSLCELYGISEDTPIQDLDISIISSLQSSGYLGDIIAKNPNKKYLNFLGANAIDITISRTAKNFGLLYIPSNISVSMKENFILIYEQCREYFMACIYVPEYKSVYDYYDNFIALCIMVMTIQQILSRSSKITIDREFFDPYCIQLLYETYGVPYYDKLDEISQKAIMQNLNMLIQNKGTSKVLFDITTLLGYDRLNIYKYYLMKERQFDADGLPITATKTVIDEDGNTSEIPDYEEMYKLYFQKVLLNEEDIHQALLDNTNKVPYSQLTTPDPYWWEDDDLYQELYESEYNYAETKYLGVSIIYRMSRILFDNTYFIKMIFDKKSEISNISLDIPKVLEYGTVSLFDAVVALCAMVCKQHNLKGEILTKPSQILHVLGFNFTKDFNLLRQEIKENPYLDNELNKYLENMTAYTVDSVNGLFENIRGLKAFITDKMATTQNIEVYHAYKELYNALYVTTENREMFKIGSGDNYTYATTYLEYLQIYNVDLYNFINETDSNDLYIYANHIISKLAGIVPRLKYLGLTIDTSLTLEHALNQLIGFFKSYTTDMVGMNIVYVYDLKPENMIRLIDKCIIHKTLETGDALPLSYSDSATLTATIRHSENVKFWERVKLSALLSVYDIGGFSLKDMVATTSTIYWDDIVKLTDKIRSMYKQIGVTDWFGFTKTTWNLTAMYHYEDPLKYNDSVNKFTKNIMNSDTGVMLIDTKDSISVNASISDTTFKMRDSIKMIRS